MATEDNSLYLKYFDITDKEDLKILLHESQDKLDEIVRMKKKYPQETSLDENLNDEREKHRAIKLALSVMDDNACLSTIEFSEYGTLDVNTIYGPLEKKFSFDFKKGSEHSISDKSAQKEFKKE